MRYAAAMTGLAAAVATTPVIAQPCAPPPALEAWASPAAAIPGRPLAIGRALIVPLSGTPRYAVPPARAAKAGAMGAAVPFVVATVGSYRVALGTPAWIDVVRAGKPVASAAHAHGTACTGIAKTVDFTLSPGRYVLQLSGAGRPAATLLIARLP